ncbi:MAG: ABC transporter substrate-binding protein [Neisseria sp.]|nr:ABC transporter substrate-binding protein [Neisseria sp.]
MHPTLKKLLGSVLLSAFVLTAAPVSARPVQDIKGRKIELAEQVNRIADLWHANNQVVLLLGGADKLVATTDVIRSNPWFAEVFPKIKTVPALTNGQSVQMEALLAVRPDAVLMSNATMRQQVEKAGMKAVLVGFQDFEGLKKTVRITAAVIGGNAPKTAETYIAELDGNIRYVAERVKNIPENRRPTVLHITGSTNLTEVDGGSSMIGEWIRLAGGRSVLTNTGNKATVSLEEIIKADPEIIIVGSGRTSGGKGIEAIKKNPAWQSLRAVKNGRLYANPSGTFPWDRYSTEEALQILWAAKLFHPEQFKDLDMAAKTQAFYKKYYNYNLSRANAERILAGQPPLGK